MEIYLHLVILILNLLIYYFYNTLPSFLKAFDVPSNKIKTHKNNIPLSGGMSICITIIFILILDDFEFRNYFIIILLFFLIYVIGFLDDLNFLSPSHRIIALTLVLLIFIFADPFYLVTEIKIYNMKININFIFGVFFTLFSFLAVINAFNFIDGIDGLSSLMLSSILILCLFLELKLNLSLVLLITSIFIYLFFNFTKKSFLGDGGIYILSSFLFFYLLRKYQLDLFSLKQIILMLSYPGIELITLSILRISNKKKIYIGDRNHLHHLFLDSYGLIKTLISIMLFFWLPNLLFNYFNLNFEIILIFFIIIYLFVFFKLIKKRGLIFE